MKVRTKSVGKRRRFFFQFNLHTQACVGFLSEDACSQQTTLSAQSSRLRRTIKTISARCFHVKYPCPTEIFVHSCLSSASSASCSTPPAYSSSSQSSQSSSIIQSPPSSRASVSALATPTLAPVRPQPRIQVSSLLADSNTRTYHLQIEQQPVSTAEFGTMYLSRVPVTPPIIARLIVRDPSGNSIVPETELPFLIAHLSLYSGDGTQSLDTGSYIGHGSHGDPPMLYGHLVSTIEQLEDLQGNMGLFFLFPDVSIRTRGRYQLGVSLMRITSSDSTGLLSEHGTLLAQARTRPFDAVPRNEYIATPPTRLTLSFIRQGARVFLNSR